MSGIDLSDVIKAMSAALALIERIVEHARRVGDVEDALGRIEDVLDVVRGQGGSVDISQALADLAKLGESLGNNDDAADRALAAKFGVTDNDTDNDTDKEH